MINLYTEEQIKRASENLANNLPDQDVQNGSLFHVSNGADISGDFTHKSLKRVNSIDCCFNKAIFKAVAGTGSRFMRTHFMNCNFNGSNFQYCYFSDTYFDNNTFAKGANFSHSIFVRCHFNHIKVRECTFFDCQFQDCFFSSSSIRSITLENSAFIHCSITKINLGHLNLEYTRFTDMSMNQVVLPPYQIAYIIGAPIYLFTTCDKIYLYTDNGKIPAKRYRDLVSDLLIYYYSQNEFFPLANILISLNKHKEAYDYIQQGIREAFDYSDFRIIKHFCRMAISNTSFSHKQLKDIYELITDLSYKSVLDSNGLHSYFMNIGEIRELLLNNSENKERVEFVIKTTIDKDDFDGVNNLYNKINQLLNQYCSEEHIDSVELRHNSPYELFITCIDTLPSIIALIPAIYALLAISGKALDVYQKFGEAYKIHQENSMFKYDKRLKELEIIQREQEIAANKQKKSPNVTGIVTISEIEHNIMCSTQRLANSLTPEYLHYKYTFDDIRLP